MEWKVLQIIEKMIKKIKKFILTHEPFKPMHMGYWIRGLYFDFYTSWKIPLCDPKHILDAGCGSGYRSNMMALKFPSAHVVGCDILSFPDWEQYGLSNLIFKQIDL